MEKLTERYELIQEKLLQIYEEGSHDIDAQITHWKLLRKEAALMYYARKHGLQRIGMQPLPNLVAAEQKAKNAIMMYLQLESLKASPYGSESWSLTETSLELYLAPPKHTFKKGGFTVDVIFDNDEDNDFPYTAWKYIYYQDNEGQWHKVEGQADYHGLFYETDTDKIYYVLIEDDAPRFSKTGTWQVKYKNKTFYASSVTSSGQPGSPADPTDTDTGESTYSLASPTRRPPSSPQQQRSRKRLRQSSSRHTRQASSEEETSTRLRRRSTTTKRRRRDPCTSGGAADLDWPSPEEVGSSHRSPKGQHCGRLGRLKEEARDPPIVFVGGRANVLKCWRKRLKDKHHKLFHKLSTCFAWAGDEESGLTNRMIVAFNDKKQRSAFLATVKFPKDTTYSLGSLDRL
ncbi:E2 [Gammapapillomavirus sp.]|uniref:E2 n=1 Tax=Gammapapillomavirus sp. TaxID=2049444 RepID=UPI000C485F30|nr:E2 [Gammapapillomavirus sp.]ATQ38646.1 E2 [Gammapapillomavirus sp.]